MNLSSCFWKKRIFKLKELDPSAPWLPECYHTRSMFLLFEEFLWPPSICCPYQVGSRIQLDIITGVITITFGCDSVPLRPCDWMSTISRRWVWGFPCVLQTKGDSSQKLRKRCTLPRSSLTNQRISVRFHHSAWGLWNLTCTNIQRNTWNWNLGPWEHDLSIC